MRVALDTNILVYAEEVNGAAHAERAHSALDHYTGDELVAPAQALAELLIELIRKARWPAARARGAVLTWQDACLVVETTAPVLLEAMDIPTLHQYSLWDSVMLAAAAQSGCRVLLSEDLHPGFVWRGVEVRPPA